MSTQFGTIVGRVVDPAGAPVPGATVAAIGAANLTRDIAAVTGSDGTFSLPGMLPGAYHVEARAGGTAGAQNVVVGPGAPIGVEIHFGGPRYDRDIMRVLGPEDPVRVTKCDQYPWRCICSLEILARDGSRSTGTGWLVAPRVVVTAGQCVFLHEAGGWASQVEVIPGRDGAQRPNGSAIATDLRSVPGWTQQHDFDYDYGAILLPADQRFGDRLGWFGFAPREDDALRQATLNIAGYPRGDGLDPTVEPGSQWYSRGTVRRVEARRVSCEIATWPDQAGSPVWEMTPNGERYAVAIHSWGTRYSNGGPRITREVFDDISRWVQEAA